MKQAQYTTVEIEQKLLDKGVQPTLQRIALCKYILCDADHPTADDVFAWAQKNMAKISQATIYNTLGVLTESGLIRTFKFPHSEKLVYDCNIEDHFHFFDEKSGRVLDIEADSVKVTLDLPKKYKIKGIDIILKGEIK
jgi:Fur family iron response transcriptional regulator